MYGKRKQSHSAVVTTTATRPPRLAGDDQRHRLTAVTGMAGLGLDAIASVAYGPEAIVLVLAAGGSAGLGWTLPVTVAIVVLLGVLIACYRQVIQAFPDGGGAYTVATRYLGRRAGLVAGASLVVDYVLNVAVSVAAGVAALTSAFPTLLPWTTELCVLVLLVVTGVNLRGIVVGAKAFALPAAVFVVSVLVVIVVGLFRPEVTAPASQSTTVGGVGVLLVLAAFGNGCSALTGVEAIANATPSFRTPRRRRARRAEAGLGLVLGVLLIGLAALIQRADVRPEAGRTILSLVTEGSVGDGWLYVVIQLSTVLLLALAANTSFGGLPVLAAKLARDDYLPHVFGLRADRLVHRHGVLVLAVLSGALLVGAEGRVDVLVPLFAIGVFVGFALAQIGMVRHWRAERGRGWVPKAVLNGFGAALTIAALIDVTASQVPGGRLADRAGDPDLRAAVQRGSPGLRPDRPGHRRRHAAGAAAADRLGRGGAGRRDHQADRGVPVDRLVHGRPGGGRARVVRRRAGEGPAVPGRLAGVAARGAARAAGLGAPPARAADRPLREVADRRARGGADRRDRAGRAVGTHAAQPAWGGGGPVRRAQHRGRRVPAALPSGLLYRCL
ncbi:LOW QUALITY PROTEIN: membrane protein, partial [Kutzneria sp. 744]